ncbi:unnamed protein product [Durusdinium trenchii]|uniref:Uncharacterized protein n=2 Tax=Durusdinium trenchii TaxID=1381693 RepID=A0ABP0S8N9_9DINO
MPGGPGLTAADHILWTQRIHKEEINARSRPDGFSVRAAVSVPDVPRKFKPGHMDPREASGGGFNPATLGWDPTGPVTKEFRRCMNQHTAVPRERHLFPETCQQEIGWIQGNCGKLAHRSEPAGSKPTRLGVGWLMKALQVDPECPKTRKSKDGNVREELGVPPYAISIPCAVWPETVNPPSKSPSSRTRSRKLTRAGENQMRRGGSMPNLQDLPDSERFIAQEAALGKAMDRSRRFLNCPSNHWYKPLSNSDVAKFADAYSKAWGVSLYGK